jgi:hypothetical protein
MHKQAEVTMKDRPILFSAPMVRAILEGRKTQTRRAVKLHGNDGLQADHDVWRFCEFHENPRRAVWQHRTNISRVITEVCRYGKPGDRLWVREAWSPDAPYVYPCPQYWYRLDFDQFSDPTLNREHCCPKESRGNHGDCFACWSENHGKFRWRPSIHMPRRASRITLEITEVRVQRLNEISEEDAIAEGIDPLFSPAEVKARPELHHDPMPWRNYLWHGDIGRGITAKQSAAWRHQYSSYEVPSGSYSSLWESINGAWAQNPWVWAVSFRRVNA